MTEEQTVGADDEIDAALRELEQQLMEPEQAETPVETPKAPTETPTETPAQPLVETPAQPTGDDDLSPAVTSWGARNREKFIEAAKGLGLELTDAKQRQQDEQALAKGAKKATAQEMLQSAMQELPQESLDALHSAEGWDELSPSEQNFLYMKEAARIEGHKIAQEAVSPLMQAQQQQQKEQFFQEASKHYATQLGNPEAAPDVYAYLSKFTDDELSMLNTQIESGGGAFMDAAVDKVKSIVAARQVLPAETEVPPAEPVGGKETYQVKDLTGPQKTFYDKLASDPDFADDPKFLATARENITY